MPCRRRTKDIEQLLPDLSLFLRPSISVWVPKRLDRRLATQKRRIKRRGAEGQGESNIRRWIIENDWLEAIIALPLNMFYNTGIATYIWVLTNRKPAHRRGNVQLIDATEWFKPLRKNLGKKNCELSAEDIHCIVQTFLDFKETKHSQIFPNAAFGYWKITVERPLRLKVLLDNTALTSFRKACEAAKEIALANLIEQVAVDIGTGPHSKLKEH